MVENSDITAIILAGGRGRRAGGIDKGWIEYQQRTLIDHMTRSLESQVGSIVISCNRNRGQYAKLGHAVVSDRRDDFQGPLAGIESALCKVETTQVFIAPVDAIALPSGLVEKMVQSHARNSAPLSWLRSLGTDFYLIAVGDTTALHCVSDYLDRGQRKVSDWYQKIGAQPMRDDTASIPNINEID